MHVHPHQQQHPGMDEEQVKGKDPFEKTADLYRGHRIVRPSPPTAVGNPLLDDLQTGAAHFGRKLRRRIVAHMLMGIFFSGPAQIGLHSPLQPRQNAFFRTGHIEQQMAARFEGSGQPVQYSQILANVLQYTAAEHHIIGILMAPGRQIRALYPRVGQPFGL
ncbi:MAG: hypothetical protein BWY83_02322 [bacterium ADurb.Bin478]|nr:MAG: hypothetical protein BWY83_02322 [bacterium ADurb.Bin478]